MTDQIDPYKCTNLQIYSQSDRFFLKLYRRNMLLNILVNLNKLEFTSSWAVTLYKELIYLKERLVALRNLQLHTL